MWEYLYLYPVYPPPLLYSHETRQTARDRDRDRGRDRDAHLRHIHMPYLRIPKLLV